MKHEDDGDSNCNWCTCGNFQNIEKQTVKHVNQRSRDYPDYSIIKINQNTEKALETWEDLLSLKL